MEIVQILVPADGIHVGVQALAGVELIALQSQTLPLGQRVDHHGGVVHGPDVEGDGALHAVEVVVEAGAGLHEEGSGDPAQIEGTAQGLFQTGTCEFFLYDYRPFARLQK